VVDRLALERPAAVAADLPRTLRHRVLELAVGVVMVEVLPAGPLAREEERPIGEEVRLAGVLDPGAGGIAEEPGRAAALGRGGPEVQPRLGAVLHVEVDPRAIRQPADSADD